MGGDRPLCNVFPNFYHLSVMKNCFVVDVLIHEGDHSFFRLFDRETMGIMTLFSLVGDFNFRQGRKDCSTMESSSFEGFLV